MISRIEGELISVEGGHAEVRVGPIVYEVLVPVADMQSMILRVGESVSLFTLHYLEAQGQGTSMIPRLIGFRSAEQRAFFKLFTTVKGMGNRKALRSLALPVATIAEAIASRDVDVLKSLPEIGKRTAETIVTELHDKVDAFVELKPEEADVVAGAPGIVEDAIQILAQLGETRLSARQLVTRALAVDPEIDTADALIAAAFRLKE